MELRTEIGIIESSWPVNHKDRLMVMGSCFAENIGRKLLEAKFKTTINPFGIIYNPSSIARSIKRMLSGEIFREQDIFEYEGQYHSFYFHSRFSNVDKACFINGINHALHNASDEISKVDFLIVTFGTAYVYELEDSAEIVSNCHKLPSRLFKNYRLSIDEIVNTWQDVIDSLKVVNPSLKVYFTVSPVRHLRNGAHDNQLSKATLLLAIEQLCNYSDNIHYYPAYELLLDELRDYRFYADDMAHPSNLAIEFIWEHFSKTFFDASTVAVITEWGKIKSAILHRPFNENGDGYKHFLKQTLLKIESFQQKYPYICCDNDIELLKDRIESLDNSKM